MNNIAKRLDGLQEQAPHKRDFLSAIDAFLSIDSVLGNLHKQLLEAQSNHNRITTRFGVDDPMAEVAADVAESAESAFHTRLIEVRRDRKIRRAVLKILRQQRAEIQRAQRKRDIYARKEMAEIHSRKLRAQQAKKEGEDSFLAVIMLLIALQETLHRTHKMLSLATAFSSANEPHDNLNRAA